MTIPVKSLACQNLKKKRRRRSKHQAARMMSEDTGITVEDAPAK